MAKVEHVIDGSVGEGGGQILRTALALSLVTGEAFRIRNIRAGRRKPGLLRQHLTAVQAARAVGDGAVDGAELGSLELVFHPGRVAPGDYRFAVGTAGSATLVLQTVLPALLTAAGPSTLKLEGGTHNPFAPPFDFLDRTFLPLINRMGPTVSATLERHGFYPAGGGRFTVTIDPVPSLRPLELMDRGEIRQRRARAMVAALSPGIAERELAALQSQLGWGEECLAVETLNPAWGPGNVLMAELVSDALTEVFTGFGERGVAAESVAETLATGVKTYLAADVPVGTHLADQLMLPMALAGGGGFRALPLSRHSLTNLEVVRDWLGCPIHVEKGENRTVTLRFG
ncbi:MAG: RNA 3'-terminal phosphate cyclase [Verrucomicrobiales bacterium]|nr:RNA 3'-terminal phosphate cyclase [Verrucomicrobiales bacterium]